MTWKIAFAAFLAMGLACAQPGRADDDSGPPRAITAKDGASMVLVPSGPFLMGDAPKPGERPRRVAASAFYIDTREVTNAQYRAFLNWVEEHGDATVRHPLQPSTKDHVPRYWKPFKPRLLKQTGVGRLQPFDEQTFRKEDHPVVGVDWFDAYAYARWAGKRLPTEAEWEKAARGDDGRIWPWGNKWDFKRCNSGGYEWRDERDGFTYTAPVGSFESGVSPVGCHDMAGNVWEWTSAADATERVIKGGGSSSYPTQVRAASRKTYEPRYRTFTLGFRCAQDVPALDGEGGDD
jgi:sulfatase modifying factor 1